MLNPVSISCSGVNASAPTALTDLDTAVAAAVAAAVAVSTCILNQIEIIPTGIIFNVTADTYVATATVVYANNN